MVTSRRKPKKVPATVADSKRLDESAWGDFELNIGRDPTPEDVAAGLAAMGSWADVDAEKMIRDLRRARRQGSRPASRPR